MKLTKFCPTKRKDDNMMLFVSDDLREDLEVEHEGLIFEVFRDLEIEVDEWILIWEIYLEDSLGEDNEILKRDADFYRAEIDLVDAQKIIIRYDGHKKEFEIDGRKSLRLPRKNRYPVVLFEPDNIYLIKSSPARRRDYFDELFKQIDDNYALALSKSVLKIHI